jgi:hypothetical protein
MDDGQQDQKNDAVVSVQVDFASYRFDKQYDKWIQNEKQKHNFGIYTYSGGHFTPKCSGNVCAYAG